MRPDLAVDVGSVHLGNPIMTASGTSGHGAELAAYIDLHSLGGVVVKSLATDPWTGNPSPRVVQAGSGMLNSVGLAGPGVKAWLDADLPRLLDAGALVVASIWGRSVDDYARAASMLRGAQVAAVEVNVSCPNVSDHERMFAQSPGATAEAVSAAGACGLPRWAKLSPSVGDLCEVAGAALEAGAEALTLVNTLLGMSIDLESRRSRLGAGGGGLSGAAIHPVAVRAVHDCRKAFPDAPIVGVGGVSTGADAVELMMAGASAVQVGTATFEDPRAPARVLAELTGWCRRHRVRCARDLIGACGG